MSDLVGNPEDRFSHNEAHFHVIKQGLAAVDFLNFTLNTDYRNSLEPLHSGSSKEYPGSMDIYV